MVALSVSISASTSPFLTVSPTFLCHPAITPSVMVSLSRGINTTSSMAATSMAGVEVTGAELAACTTGAGVAAGVAGWAPALAPECCVINAETSSPALPKMASRLFTCNFPPLGVPMYNKTPSW